MNEAHVEQPRLDRCVDVLVCPALGTKQTVVSITLHPRPARQSFATYEKRQRQHQLLFSSSPAGFSESGPCTHNSPLFEPDSKCALF